VSTPYRVTLAAARVIGKESAQMRIFDLFVVRLKHAPG
jgi:hypothetical protein